MINTLNEQDYSHREQRQAFSLNTPVLTTERLVLRMPVHDDADELAVIANSREIAEMTALSPEEQEAEMQWFIDAAQPFAGMEINVVSETITTHEYESKVLAPAFSAITGIKVTHDLIGEGDVVEKLQTQMQTGENIYDAYINDSDLIGTHWRYQQARDLTKWMADEGKDVTSPTLDLPDFIGLKFTTAPDGKLYVQRQNRAQTKLDLLRVDPATGASTLVFSEEAKAPSWVNLSMAATKYRRSFSTRFAPLSATTNSPRLRRSITSAPRWS